MSRPNRLINITIHYQYKYTLVVHVRIIGTYRNRSCLDISLFYVFNIMFYVRFKEKTTIQKAVNISFSKITVANPEDLFTKEKLTYKLKSENK